MNAADKIPVVFIHRGQIPLYLVNAIEQAVNFDNRVVLITDNASASVSAEIMNCALLSQDEKEFRSYYKHMSTNPYDFEFVCIYRWFLLKNYISMMRLDRVLYFDSDVYLYGNSNEIVRHYAYPKFGYNVPACQKEYFWAGSASCSVWNADSLVGFCECIENNYTTDRIEVLEEKWNHHIAKSIPGGICDMTLLYLFSNTPGFVNLGKVHEKCCFDFNNGIPGNYEESEYEFFINRSFGFGTKRIQFIDGLPYCKNVLTGEEVRFFAITEYAKFVLAGQRQTLKNRLKRRLFGMKRE